MRRRLEIARGPGARPEKSCSGRTHHRPGPGLPHFGVGDDRASARPAGPHAPAHHALHDEADRLCDRVAIIDSGRMVALDTPVALKASVPGASRIELQFEPDLPTAPPTWSGCGGQVGARAGLGHLSHFERPRPGFGGGVDRTGARAQAGAESFVGRIHQSGRRIPALHRHGLAEMEEAAAPAGRGKKGGPR